MFRGKTMKNYWLSKAGDDKPNSETDKFEMLTESLSNYGEQELALYLIDKYKSNSEFRDKIKIALWQDNGEDCCSMSSMSSRSSSINYTIGADLSCECNDCVVAQEFPSKGGFPQDDEFSIQQGCPCDVNLDMYYTHQFMQNETVRPSAINVMPTNEYEVTYKLEKDKILRGSTVGTIFVGSYGDQTFEVDDCGNMSFKNWNNTTSSAIAGKMDSDNGLIKLIWNGVPLSTFLVVCYEYLYKGK
jgi:hypothetical protein